MFDTNLSSFEIKIRNGVFATKLNFMITLSLQLYDVILWYFKVKLFDLTECIIVWIYDIVLQRYWD